MTIVDRKTSAHNGAGPFRRAVAVGLGVLVPPLLTVLIFLWIGSSVNQYVLRPVVGLAREAVVWAIADVRTDPTASPNTATLSVAGTEYVRLDDDSFVPREVYERVRRHPTDDLLVPKTGLGVYRRYVEIKYLKPYFVIPFFLSIFILLLYLLGKFMAAGVGRFFWSLFEWGINRVPFVRSVYSGVKQVTDFMFNEREIEFNRVVAVEYPRKGIWSLGFVTGESFLEIRAAANEPVLAVYIPCSPLPLTGYTVNCLKSECIDLNMTFDQACQFMISCGVVVPPHQVETHKLPATATPAAPTPETPLAG